MCASPPSACRWTASATGSTTASSGAAQSEEPQALTALVAELRARLTAAGVRYDPKPFVSHVTLVRNAASLPEAPAWIPLVWEARDFALVGSTRIESRVSYAVMQRFPAAAS